MALRSAIFTSGLPAVASSPASAYLTSTVPPTGAVTRHLVIRSSSAAICASRAAELSLMVAVFLPRVDSNASILPCNTFICASMSSRCFLVAAPSASILSTLCSSRFCLAICSRSDATCLPTSGHELSSAVCCASNCLRCRCSCRLSITANSVPASIVAPSSILKSRILPADSEETITSVASKVPCASNSLSLPHDTVSIAMAMYANRFMFINMSLV